MAESAVKSTADFLGKILVEEGKYLWGAEGKVEELLDELLWMRSFLREADTLQHADECVRVWVSRIKDHVSEAEDIIDDFVIKVASRRRQTGLLNKLKRYSCILREFYHLHQSASSIDSLKDKISTLAPKLERYGLKRSLGINTNIAQEALVEQVQQSLKYAYLEDKKIIGLERNAKEVIDALKSTTSNKGFHAIFGMGGLGKTTLATKVYRDDGIKQHFTGGQAFVYISKQFQRKLVLQDVCNQLSKSSKEGFDDSKLQEVLKKNKCLVVIDDVWKQEDWEILKPALTACGGDSGSKVLLTTRKEDVAKYVDPDALRKPDPLSEDESWELLRKMIGWDPQESSISQGDSEKKKVGEEMLKVCNGLPLAIVALGGILRKKQTLSEWISVKNSICSYLRMGSDHGRSCMDILLQSYYDLPFHLKPCFLHLAHFPDVYKIQTPNIYCMWAAEGLVTRSTSGSNKSMEEVANDYMCELALSGLVEIVDKTSEGWIESIRMHDLVRDVCLEKATTEDFLKIIDLRPGQDNRQLTTSDYYSAKRLLRMSIYLPQVSSRGHKRPQVSSRGPEESTVESSTITDSLSSRGHKYLRSLLFTIPFTHRDYEDEAQGKHLRYQQLMESICNEFQMLRVLVLKNMRLKGRLTSQVGNLLHLRYLSLENTIVSELPSSIGKLSFLEILNLNVDNSILIIPNTLWKLFRLRHLVLPEDGYEIKKSIKLSVDTLIWLETIENMRVEKHRTKDLLKMKNLRKLTTNGQVSNVEEMVDIIAALKPSVGGLGSCSKIFVGGDVICKEPKILSGLACNHELKICGKIAIRLTDHVEYFSQYLVKLELEGCEFEDDPMPILGSLCHLTSLNLGYESYVGKKLSCHSNSFPFLGVLEFWGLKKLEVWELEGGSMPQLEVLIIHGCINLNEIPNVLPTSLDYCYIGTAAGNLEGGVNLELDDGVQMVDPYESEKWLKDALLLEAGEYVDKVVILGKRGAGKAIAIEMLYCNRDVNVHFDAVARTCVPSRRRSDGLIIPRRMILKQLLRDLNAKINDEELCRMSCENLKYEIQKVMKERKCLVILEEVDLHCLCVEDLETTFGLTGGRQEGFQSKLVISSSITDNDQLPAAAVADKYNCHPSRVFKLGPPTPLNTWKYIFPYDVRNAAGIKWNMMRKCSHHPLSALLLAGLIKMKKGNLAEWATKDVFEQLTISNPQKMFAMCYDDLPLHLRSCLIFLANFPADVEIPTKRLFWMWIAAGFVDQSTEDQHLENLARTYLIELVDRGMVTIVKERPNRSAKTCRLKFALRDMCLEKAKEEHILTIFDLFERATNSTSNTKFKTKQLALHFDQISSSTADQQETHVDSESRDLYKRLMDCLDVVDQDTRQLMPYLKQDEPPISPVDCINSLESILIFPNVTDPLYNEEKWEWLIYICKHFQLLRVLDLEGMWMMKGSLPKHVGDLTQLRYLSLKGTWVTELPRSIENLSSLQTLDLRVLESIIIPNVLWKLDRLMNLCLPDHFILAQETAGKLRIHGLNCLQTLVNLQTDIVCLNDLLLLKQLRKISIRKIHADAADELNNILEQLSKSLEVSINSEVINANQTILSSFQNLHRLKIKGLISVELRLEMFHTQLEELTLKHTKLEGDPLLVLENLPKLRSLYLGHQSFSGKAMTFSGYFQDRTVLTLCSLRYLEKLYVSIEYCKESNIIYIIDCWRVSIEEPSTSNTREEQEKQVVTHPTPKCFDLSPLKKPFTCW